MALAPALAYQCVALTFIAAKIKWIMLVSGALTCTMVYVAIAPQAALLSTFGETLDGPLADVVVRSWGVLIALMGAMLIYGAFDPPARSFVLTVTGASKLVFIGLVLSHGGLYLSHQAGIAVAIDFVWVVLFACCLLRMRATPRT